MLGDLILAKSLFPLERKREAQPPFCLSQKLSSPFQRSGEPGGLCLGSATHRFAYKTQLGVDAKSSFLLNRDSLSFRGKSKNKNISVLLCKLKNFA